MTIANPVSEAQGFIADYEDLIPLALALNDGDNPMDDSVELGQAARIMQALLDDHRAHVAYLEGELRKAHDEGMWDIDFNGTPLVRCESLACEWEIPMPEGEFSSAEVMASHVAELLRWPR